MKMQTGNVVQMKKSVQRVGLATERRELREATTGRIVLTQVWAVAEQPDRGMACEALRRDAVVNPEVGAHRAKPIPVKDGIAFYRKYTEGMLQRYLQLSMGGGRVASLLRRGMLGREITNYSVQNYEGVSIFCVDVELCLKKLTPMERELLKRIAIQQYSQEEAAMTLGISWRSCSRRYSRAVDKLTSIFLEARIIEPFKYSQEDPEMLRISK